MEVLLDDYTNSGRSHRLMGFIDIGVAYNVVGTPFILKDSNNAYRWEIDNERKALVIEVKSAWPTVGNLMRQLNLYRACVPRGFGEYPKYLLVGPDDSMNKVAQQHGYDQPMTTLYLQMTEKLIAHWKGNSYAYPQRYVLSPALRDEYVRCLNLMTIPGDRDMSATKHMGVPIEVDEASPGVMVAADGTEVALQ